jgi:hypothetical protein
MAKIEAYVLTKPISCWILYLCHIGLISVKKLVAGRLSVTQTRKPILENTTGTLKHITSHIIYVCVNVVQKELYPQIHLAIDQHLVVVLLGKTHQTYTRHMGYPKPDYLIYGGELKKDAIQKIKTITNFMEVGGLKWINIGKKILLILLNGLERMIMQTTNLLTELTIMVTMNPVTVDLSTMKNNNTIKEIITILQLFRKRKPLKNGQGMIGVWFPPQQSKEESYGE